MQKFMIGRPQPEKPEKAKPLQLDELMKITKQKTRADYLGSEEKANGILQNQINLSQVPKQESSCSGQCVECCQKTPSAIVRGRHTFYLREGFNTARAMVHQTEDLTRFGQEV